MADILEVPTDEMQANLYLTYFCCTETSLMQTEARYETILNKFQINLNTVDPFSSCLNELLNKIHIFTP